MRGFLRKKISQVVSGAFIGIFLYCLLLLIAVRETGDENEPFVPSLGVIVAVGLSLLGLVLLILFIHRLSQTIQVSTMTASIADETLRAVAAVHSSVQSVEPGESAGDGDPIHADGSGYVRGIAALELRGRPADDATIEFMVRPGDFVSPRTVIARVRADDVARLTEPVRAVIVVRTERDIDQDPAFGIRQLADIALRAISPGINDPTTAVTCLGYLGAILEVLAVQATSDRVALRMRGARVVLRVHDLAAYLEPFTEIARYAVDDARVTCALLSALQRASDCARSAGRDDNRVVIDALALDLGSTALENVETEHDRVGIRGLLARFS